MIDHAGSLTPEFMDAVIPIAAMIPFMDEEPSQEDEDRFNRMVDEVAEEFEVDGEFVVSTALMLVM